mgnify:CR=1 FL=1
MLTYKIIGHGYIPRIAIPNTIIILNIGIYIDLIAMNMHGKGMHYINGNISRPQFQNVGTIHISVANAKYFFQYGKSLNVIAFMSSGGNYSCLFISSIAQFSSTETSSGISGKSTVSGKL